MNSSSTENILAALGNLFLRSKRRRIPPGQLHLGHEVIEEQYSTRPVYLFQNRRPEHIAILGKTGMGKSSLLRLLCAQDIRRDHAFIFFDLHGDATPMLLRVVAQEERRRGIDLSRRLIIFDPADREHSVGLNILEIPDDQHRFVQVADLAQILRDRWHLDTLGVRTEELLRNALHVLIDNQLTIIELGPLLVDDLFRARCLQGTKNTEARKYFTTRYNPLSEPMRALYREAVLNKVTVFTSDPHFRHLLGQTRSTVDLAAVVEGGHWIIFNLDKGRLGEQAATLGSLLLTTIRHSLFGRRSRSILTLYCDEIQNLVVYDGGIESLFSEARKLGISVTSANQYLDQYSASMQAAIFSVGTMIFFQLSARDATRASQALGGGRYLTDRIKNLPPREMIVKLSTKRPLHVRVPKLSPLSVRPESLYRRSRTRFARSRRDIEAEILRRTGHVAGGKETLDAWD